MYLSNQAVGAVMFAVIRGMQAAEQGLDEECDITNILKEFVLRETEEGLVVENPPVLQFDEQTDAEV
jgi:hypothetical protein